MNFKHWFVVLILICSGCTDKVENSSESIKACEELYSYANRVDIDTFYNGKFNLLKIMIETYYDKVNELPGKTIVIDSKNNYYFCKGFDFINFDALVEKTFTATSDTSYYKQVLNLLFGLVFIQKKKLLKYKKLVFVIV